LTARDQLGERLTFDVLHGVVVDAALRADRVDRDDMRMMQAGRCPRFVAEPLQLAFVQQAGQRQNLQRDAALERRLLRFVHHAHPTPTEFPADAEVAQQAAVQEVAERGRVAAGGRLRRAGRGLQSQHGRQHLAQLARQARIVRHDLLDVDHLALPVAAHHVIDDGP
jgi:hypothetical protein